MAGIDAQVQVYRFFLKGADGAGAPELAMVCEYVGHMMSLYCKTAGDLVLVGDILRSMSVLQLKQITSTSGSGTEIITLKEVSRDFNSNYMRAVEFLNADYFMGSEDNGNLFIEKRPGGEGTSGGSAGVALTEEEKSRLEMQSAFHLGDFVNVFQRGMLGSNTGGMAGGEQKAGTGSGSTGTSSSSTTTASTNKSSSLEGKSSSGESHSFGSSVSPLVLFGTVGGCIGAVFSLSAETFHFLDVLERSLNHVIRGVGGLSHDEYRRFAHERRQVHARRTIDGDLIEMFLDLPEVQMQQVTKHLNGELHHLAQVSLQEASKKKKDKDLPEPESEGSPSFTLEEIIQRLEELVRLH